MRRYARLVLRNLPYLLVLVPSSIVTAAITLGLIAVVCAVYLGGIGLVLLPWYVQGVRRWTDVHRRSIGRMQGHQIPLRYQRMRRGGVRARLRQTLTDRVTWRDIGWMFAHSVVGFSAGIIALSLLAGVLSSVWAVMFWWLPYRHCLGLREHGGVEPSELTPLTAMACTALLDQATAEADRAAGPTPIADR